MARMISVVIATHNDERTLGQSLAALVPAAVDGLVREVILADAGSTDDTLEIAEDAGARVVRTEGPEADRLARGCEAARGDWLLLLQAGHVPPAGWAQAAVRHLAEHPGRAGYWGGSALRLFAGSAPAVLAPRRLYDEVGGYRPGFLRRLGGRVLRLRVAPPR